MKAYSMYVWSLLVIIMGLTACGNDEKNSLSTEQQAYINKNKEYIWQKKAEKDESGQLLYKQIPTNGDTVLYRVVKKENNYTSMPNLNSTVYLKDLEGHHIDGRTFQPKVADSNFRVNSLIPGFAYVLLNTHLDETIEAIIPASLGYGFTDNRDIPAGSTLIFTFKLDKIE